MYTAFASVYDRLMADVDYLAWARFYHELMERYGVPAERYANARAVRAASPLR